MRTTRQQAIPELGLTNLDPLMTTRQAGQYLGFTDEFVRQQIAAGLIETVLLGSRPRIRVRRSALEAYIAASTHTNDPISDQRTRPE